MDDRQGDSAISAKPPVPESGPTSPTRLRNESTDTSRKTAAATSPAAVRLRARPPRGVGERQPPSPVVCGRARSRVDQHDRTAARPAISTSAPAPKNPAGRRHGAPGGMPQTARPRPRTPRSPGRGPRQPSPRRCGSRSGERAHAATGGPSGARSGRSTRAPRGGRGGANREQSQSTWTRSNVVPTAPTHHVRSP